MEVTQKLSLWLCLGLKHWPRHQAEKGFLFWIICPDFLWEELWDLENTAYLCLFAVVITAGAMIFSAILSAGLVSLSVSNWGG